MDVKFAWNGLKINGEFHKCSYSEGPYTKASGLPEGTITMYAAGYESIPRIPGLSIENETDIMTDYFETDTVRILPNSPFYADARKALVAHLIHIENINIKQLQKRMEQSLWHEEFYRDELERAEKRLSSLQSRA